MKKHRVFAIDEGQIIAKKENFAEKLLRLRHAGVSLVINFQNLSTAPIELLANSDFLVSFQAVDKRDQDAFGSVAGLNLEQRRFLGTLEQGQCVCVLPRSGWKNAFLAETLPIDFRCDDQR